MKKGFTLIELLAVIVILALLALISTPIILNVIEDVKVNAFNNQVEIIEDTADKYLMGNIEDEVLKIGQTVSIKLQDLYDKGLLKNVKNPHTGESFDANSIVYATRVNDNKINYYFEGSNDCRYNGKKCLAKEVEKDLVGKSQNYQDGTYYRGTNEEITNNYVWYSGQEYRIMGINNDGSIKMVTSLPVVNLSWGPVGEVNYENSYVRKWLNILPEGHSLKDEYEGVFYKSLSHPDFLVDYDFCIGKQDPTNSTDTTCSTKLTDKIGLLTWWEYKIADSDEDGEDSYIDSKDFLALLTGDARNDNNLLTSYYTGSIYNEQGVYASYPIDYDYGNGAVRPVINLKSTVSIVSGDGTSENSYRLFGDEEGEKDDYLNSRYAGEYVNFAGQKYRIVSKNNKGNTKILLDRLAISTGTTEGHSDASYFDLGDGTNTCQSSDTTYCNNHFDITDGNGDYNGDLGHNLGYFLNSNASNSFYTSLGSYQSYLDNETYFFGKWKFGSDYKVVYTDASTNGYGTQDLKVGLLHYGEMLAGDNNNSSSSYASYWLISPYDSSDNYVSFIDSYGYVAESRPSRDWLVVHPTITLKSTVKIVSGDGTRDNPYEIIK